MTPVPIHCHEDKIQPSFREPKTHTYVTKYSQITGKYLTYEYPYSFELMQAALNQWKTSATIQIAFYFCTADEREFLMTGITPEQWDQMFS